METKLGISVALITPDSLIQGALDSPLASAIIVDCSVITDEIFRRYSEFKESQQKDTLEILINCDQSISTEDLFAWRTLAGIFYTSDDIKTLQVGIGKVLQGGDMWFSRKFSQQYITHLRRHCKPINKNVPAILTKREQQIITFLSMGGLPINKLPNNYL